MATATITSKGQVTIPKTIRDAMGLRTGDRIDFTQAPGGTVVIRPKRIPFERVIGILKRPGQKAVSVEAMDEGIGAYVRKAYRPSIRQDE